MTRSRSRGHRNHSGGASTGGKRSRSRTHSGSAFSTGMIRRSAYHRKAYTREDGTHVKASYVPSSMIKDRGVPGKGPKVIKMDRPPKVDLAEHGYSMSKNSDERHAAIRKAIKDYGALETLHKLNALRTLHKNDSAKYAKLDKDVKYVQAKIKSSK